MNAFRYAIALVAVLALCSAAGHAQTVQTTHYNVRMVVATETQANGPNKWFGTADWAYLDQGFHTAATTVYVLPYGSAVPTGGVEFPGEWQDSASLAYAAYGLNDGQCVKVDVQQLSKANKFGNVYRVVNIHSSGC